MQKYATLLYKSQILKKIKIILKFSPKSVDIVIRIQQKTKKETEMKKLTLKTIIAALITMTTLIGTAAAGESGLGISKEERIRH